jgi:serine/threonine-protein phosphatase 4 catalytic subunit
MFCFSLVIFYLFFFFFFLWLLFPFLFIHFSAPNYCYRCGNVASILALDGNLDREFKIFKEVPESSRIVPARTPSSYFL